jgi:hypothetical protein
MAGMTLIPGVAKTFPTTPRKPRAPPRGHSGLDGGTSGYRPLSGQLLPEPEYRQVFPCISGMNPHCASEFLRAGRAPIAEELYDLVRSGPGQERAVAARSSSGPCQHISTRNLPKASGVLGRRQRASHTGVSDRRV